MMHSRNSLFRNTKERRRDHHHAGDAEGFQLVMDQVLISPTDRQRFYRSNASYQRDGLSDFLIATSNASAQPSMVFSMLHWGGQFIFVARRPQQAQAVLDQYQTRNEFLLESGVEVVSKPRWERFHTFRARYYYFVARKVSLTWGGVATDRYTYDARLVPDRTTPGGYVIRKQVPTLENAIDRLTWRYHESSAELIESGAKKLVNKVFPIFLTREAAFLKILERALPAGQRPRIPSVLHLEQDGRGLVQKLYLNWLRLGGEPITQLDFATQSTDLLRTLHDKVGLIHMDLRLDNFVVTERGVGFVDFRSAARVGESFIDSPLYGFRLNSARMFGTWSGFALSALM